MWVITVYTLVAVHALIILEHNKNIKLQCLNIVNAQINNCYLFDVKAFVSSNNTADITLPPFILLWMTLACLLTNFCRHFADFSICMWVECILSSWQRIHFLCKMNKIQRKRVYFSKKQRTVACRQVVTYIICLLILKCRYLFKTNIIRCPQPCRISKIITNCKFT